MTPSISYDGWWSKCPVLSPCRFSSAGPKPVGPGVSATAAESNMARRLFPAPYFIDPAYLADNGANRYLRDGKEE